MYCANMLRSDKVKNIRIITLHILRIIKISICSKQNPRSESVRISSQTSFLLIITAKKHVQNKQAIS